MYGYDGVSGQECRVEHLLSKLLLCSYWQILDSAEKAQQGQTF